MRIQESGARVTEFEWRKDSERMYTCVIKERVIDQGKPRSIGSRPVGNVYHGFDNLWYCVLGKDAENWKPHGKALKTEGEAKALIEKAVREKVV